MGKTQTVAITAVRARQRGACKRFLSSLVALCGILFGPNTTIHASANAVAVAMEIVAEIEDLVMVQMASPAQGTDADKK